jgi:hypothetical protein
MAAFNIVECNVDEAGPISGARASQLEQLIAAIV